MPHQHPLTSRGQATSEYGLAIGLVVLAAIGGLALLSGQVNTMLTGSVNNVFGQKPAAVASVPRSQPVAPRQPLSENIDITNGNTSLRLGNGTVVALQLPDALGEAIETSGANGTTEQLLAQTERLISAASSSGQIDAEQTALLQQLSNQGHRIAQVQNVLESHLAKAPQGTDFNDYMRNTVVKFEGRSVRLDILADSIDYNGYDFWLKKQPKENYLVPNPANSPGTTLRPFLELYQQAQKTGALNDPVMSATIETMVLNIAKVSTSMVTSLEQNFSSTESSGSERVSQLRDLTVDHFGYAGGNVSSPLLKDTVSETSDAHSEVICTNGNGKAKGKSCD